MSDRMLTTGQVAARYGVTSPTVLDWVQTRGLPAKRLTSRAIRYAEDELEAWEAEHSTADVTDDRELSRTQPGHVRHREATQRD